ILVFTITNRSNHDSFLSINGVCCVAKASYLLAHMLHLFFACLGNHGNDHRCFLFCYPPVLVSAPWLRRAEIEKARQGGGLDELAGLLVQPAHLSRSQR